MILGFDFGMKYIGVATGQAITKSATPLTCLRATDGIPDWAEVEQLIVAWKPSILIVGYPLNMDDSVQHLSHSAKKFANRLQQKFKLPIHLVDERLSTWEVKQQLYAYTPKPTNKQLTEINAKAAALLIEQWLEDH